MNLLIFPWAAIERNENVFLKIFGLLAKKNYQRNCKESFGLLSSTHVADVMT